MDRFKAMQTFVQIADQGSLTRAAEALGTSLPAVVRSLAALEAHLGVRLFHRTTRRLSLTEEGRTTCRARATCCWRPTPPTWR
jgi:DNA-binding transcriptional LysR family regulator